MNKKVATLNIPALWSPIPAKGINKRVYKGSLPYEQDGQVKVASDKLPIYRYAKNFEVGGLKFSMCLFTDDNKQSNITKYFKSIANKLTKQQISKALMTATSSSFTYLNESYGDIK